LHARLAQDSGQLSAVIGVQPRLLAILEIAHREHREASQAGDPRLGQAQRRAAHSALLGGDQGGNTQGSNILAILTLDLCWKARKAGRPRARSPRSDEPDRRQAVLRSPLSRTAEAAGEGKSTPTEMKNADPFPPCAAVGEASGFAATSPDASACVSNLSRIFGAALPRSTAAVLSVGRPLGQPHPVTAAVTRASAASADAPTRAIVVSA
jgi:hypothetical protein